MNKEKLNWEKKQRFNFAKVIDQVNNLSKEVILRDLKDAVSKVEMLHTMGFIKDDEQIKKMREKVKELNLQGK